ncbi:MAG: transposase [Candidatus Levybacteria bacterium]|nr:transposase [Candidatus Levybacteria bacterium]
MSSRVVPFVNGEYYHVFNRGVAKMQIFFSFYDYTRFTKTFLYYMIDCAKPKFSIFTPTTHELDTNKRIVEVICYCLMPNHFHFLLRQKREGGITEFISKLSNSYTKYFNVKNRRIGPMLQGEFKAVHIETNEQLLHLSRSSYMEYIGFIKNDTCSKEVVLDQFKSLSEYKQFVLDQEDYGKKLESIKHQLIDSED